MRAISIMRGKMPPMNTLIINNLASGAGAGAIYDLVRVLARDGSSVTLRSTDGTTDLRELTHDAQNFDVVVASGGDGTISTVAYQLAYSNTPILPFPAGTSNLLAQNTWLPNEVHALAQLATGGKKMRFDMGEVALESGRYGFCIMAGCGYDALIMRDAKRVKKLFGPAAYFGAAITNIAPTHAEITLEVDGVKKTSSGVGVLVVNFSKIPFDLSVTHENAPRDGLLDVVVLKANNALELLPVLGAALLDRGGKNPDRANLEIFRGKHIRIETEPPLPVQFDGEPTLQYTPFEVNVMPGAMNMLISDAGYELFA